MEPVFGGVRFRMFVDLVWRLVILHLLLQLADAVSDLFAKMQLVIVLMTERLRIVMWVDDMPDDSAKASVLKTLLSGRTLVV